jgi:hypothetical protein
MYKKLRKQNFNKRNKYQQDKKILKILDKKFLYKIKVLKNLIKIVFKLKPSKKFNKICLYFFNKKKRRINFE